MEDTTVITLANLKSFFSPRHIAVVGATANNQWFGNFLANAAETGFDGRFYPVNPGTDEIYGVKAYRSIANLPDGIIDFAVLVVKSSLVPGALEEVGGKGRIQCPHRLVGIFRDGPRRKADAG